MRFANGVLGVVIVIAAIMVTVLAGILLNTEEVTTEKQEFTYVTNVTGLFEHTNVEEYLDYNPVENWTGYRADANTTPTSGITFETLPSGQSNLYPVNTDRVTGTGLREMNSNLRDQPGPFNRTGYDTVFHLYDGTDTGLIGTAAGGITVGYYSDVQTMAKIIDWLNLAGTVTEIRINVEDPNTSMRFNRISDWTRDPVVGSTTQTWTADLAAAEAIDWINVSVKSGIVRAVTDDAVVWTSNVNDVVGMVRARTIDNGNYVGDWQYLGMFYSIVEGSGVEYMDTAQGIKFEMAQGQLSGGALWSNGHKNDRISVLVHTPTIQTNNYYDHNEWTMNVAGTGNDPPSTWWIGISISFYEDRVQVQYGTRVLATLGPFDTVLVTADTTAQTFTVTPVMGFVNFDSYQTIPNAAFTTQMSPLNRAPDYIDWVAFGSMWMGLSTQVKQIVQGVVDTRVFMNSYNAVVKDETIRISEWFPDYELYKIQFNSFGLTGNSIRIGAATYPVADGKVTVTVPGGDRATIPLDLFTVTYEKVDGRWKITASSEHTKPVTLSTGASSDTIGFSGGYWLFSSGLYRGETVTVTNNEIDLNGWAFGDTNVAIVTYFGFLVLGTAVSTRIQTVSLTDLAVVGCAGICGWVLMGV